MLMKHILMAPLSASRLTYVVSADTESSAAKVLTFRNVLQASEIFIGGFIDTSYTYLPGAGVFTRDVPNRVFDREHNSFNLNLVDITATYQPEEGFGGFIQRNAGSDANVFAPLGTGTDDEFDVQEAFGQYAVGAFTFIGGKFATLAGAEVTESPADLNFTRSILFGYAIPFTHTGVRLQMETAGGTTFSLGVNNGWDVFRESAAVATDDDTADDKTVELGAIFAPFEPLSVSGSAYTGDEPGAVAGRRNLIDVVLNYTATDALSFAVNGDVAQQDDAIAPGADADWHGVAGYANYQFTDQWRAALRGEWFDDEDGFRTSVAQQWKEVTGTSAYMPTEVGRYAPKRAATGRTKTASWTPTAASVTANTRLI
jgi:hypothetical protein